MLAIVWRVTGEGFDVEAFLRDFGIVPDNLWRKGEPHRAGAPAAAAGFNLSLDRDDDDLDHALQDLRRFLRERQLALEVLQERGGRSTIDIGITVGGGRHYTRSLRIPAADLAELGRSGIELEVSAYPSCDDEDDSVRAPRNGAASD